MGNQEIENDVAKTKKLSSVNTITLILALRFIFWSYVFGEVSNVIVYAINEVVPINSIIISTIIATILLVISLYFTWKLTIKRTFRSRVVLSKDVPTIMVNLLILTIIAVVLMFVSGFTTASKEVEKEAEKAFLSLDLKMVYSTKEQKEKYERKKKIEIDRAKERAYVYVAVADSCSACFYFISLYLIKKDVYAYSVE